MLGATFPKGSLSFVESGRRSEAGYGIARRRSCSFPRTPPLAHEIEAELLHLAENPPKYVGLRRVLPSSRTVIDQGSETLTGK